MKWFKHISQSKSDPDIIGAEMKFGGDGPHVFFRALEILACENSHEISMPKDVFYAYFFRPYRKKVRQILTWFSEKQRKNAWRFDETENIIELSVNKFRYLSMPYTKKHEKKSEQKSPIEGEGDKKKIKKENIYGASFNIFWNAYPKKKSKEKAAKAWEKLDQTPQLLLKIMDAVAAQKLTIDWQKDKGQFIPHAATWINGKLWQDDVLIPSVARPRGNTPDEIKRANGIPVT